MGKGDRKSKKGKVWRKSYGNSRNRKAIKLRMKRASSKKKVTAGVEPAPKAKRTTKKA